MRMIILVSALVLLVAYGERTIRGATATPAESDIVIELPPPPTDLIPVID